MSDFVAMLIRTERPDDEDAIRRVTKEAFTGAVHSDGNEASIIDELRNAGALTISLVAEERQEGIVGHVAVSPVLFEGVQGRWYGLGPVAVRPDRQRRGIAASLIEESLAMRRDLNADGCVVLGNPTYYARFGFANDARATFPGVAAGYFQVLSFSGRRPSGAPGRAPPPRPRG